jgi:hypothetical protein
VAARRVVNESIGGTVLVLRQLVSSVVDVGISGPEFFDSRFAAGKIPWDFGGVSNLDFARRAKSLSTLNSQQSTRR